MTRRWLPIVLLFTGCTIINDPGMHTGNQPDVPLPPDVPPTEQIRYDDFCDELAEFLCGAFDDCCDLAEPPAACVSTVTEACDATFGATLLSDARTGYDPVRAAQVFAEGQALVDDCDIAIIPWVRTAVPRILAGIRGPGMECTPVAMDGGFDFAALLSCEGDDYSCFYNGLDAWTCNPRVGEGRGCYTDYDCLDGMFCDPPASGTCQVRLPAGAPCNRLQDHCAGVCGSSETCVEPTQNGLYCNIFTAVR